EKGAHEIFRLIPHPSIANGSFAIRTFFDLESALAEALKDSDTVIIEELIEGRPATCAVIDGFRGQERYALLPVGEMDAAESEMVQEAAKAIHGRLGLRHYSHSEFIIHPKRGIF